MLGKTDSCLTFPLQEKFRFQVNIHTGPWGYCEGVFSESAYQPGHLSGLAILVIGCSMETVLFPIVCPDRIIPKESPHW